MDMKKIGFAMAVALLMSFPVALASSYVDGSFDLVSDDSKNLSEIINDPIIILEDNNLKQLDQKSISTIAAELQKGKPLITQGDVCSLQIDKIPLSSGQIPDVSGFYYNEKHGARCVFYAYGMNAMENAEDWANRISSEVESYAYGGNSDFCWYDGEAENSNMKMYVRVDITKVGVVENETYYVLHHTVNTIVKDTSDDRETSSVTVSGDTNNNPFCRLLASAPEDSIVPDKDVSVSVGLSVSVPSGISLNSALTWNYVSQYSQVDNDTDLSEGTYEITTDYNEEEFQIDNNMTIQPGVTVAVFNDSQLTMSNHYEMEVRQKYAEKLWPWDPVWEFRTISVDRDIVLDP